MFSNVCFLIHQDVYLQDIMISILSPFLLGQKSSVWWMFMISQSVDFRCTVTAGENGGATVRLGGE